MDSKQRVNIKNIQRSNSYADEKGDETLLDYRHSRTNTLCFVIIIILQWCWGFYVFAFGRYVTRIPNVILGELVHASLWVNGFTRHHAVPRITVSKAMLLLQN